MNEILLVDDDISCRNSLKLCLKELLPPGYKVAINIAASGEEALQMVQQQNYDAVLMDTEMGGMAGYEACAQMKMQNPEQVVIGMSSNRSYRSAWMEAGANAFVPKFDFVESVNGILVQYLQKEEKKLQ